ncbi:MAG: hypothetical protein Q8L15_04555 [Methylobacter sp.]|nr:hypothetical protein [Methylobacter sp.]
MQIDALGIQHIEELRTEISRLRLSEEVKADALDIVSTVEDQFKSGNPKKSVVSALLSSLPNVERITSIVTAISNLL